MRFIAVCGPTASGKSDLALNLARRFSGEIVCCDSVQIYQGFDIGSAKPTPEEQILVPHHLFDLLRCDEDFSAGAYREHARKKLAEIHNRGSIPIVVGGTGLYLRALMGTQWDEQLPSDESLRLRLTQMSSEKLVEELRSLDPQRLNELHPNDRYRLVRALELVHLTGKTADQRANESKACSNPLEPLLLVMDPPRAVLHDRINLRSRQMLERGLVEEVKRLRKLGCAETSKPMQSIGYGQVNAFLNGQIAEVDLCEAIAAATRQYAKRQVTWFKKVNADMRIQTETPGPDVERMVEAYLRK